MRKSCSKFNWSRSVLIASVFAMCCVPCLAQLPEGWMGTGVGSSGSVTYQSGVFTVQGSGRGFSPGTSDQLYFVYKKVPAAGNFRLIARLASFNGNDKSQGGLIVRADCTPAASAGGVVCEPGGLNSTPGKWLCIFDRNNSVGPAPQSVHLGEWSSIKAPCWLELLRYGNNFATWKSSDGIHWSQIENDSGGSFSAKGDAYVGFYVSSGGGGTDQATFDHVSLTTTPSLRYETSWIGNTFSSADANRMAGAISAMWVGPDGSCYANCCYTEDGQGGKVYKNGRVINFFKNPPGTGDNGGFEGSITSDGSNLFFWGKYSKAQYGIFETDMQGDTKGFVPIHTTTPLTNSDGLSELSGLASINGKLYISDAQTNQILVASPSWNLYQTSQLATNNIVTHSIDTGNVVNPAPPAVYQSQYESDLLPYTFSGLTPGTNYTVRLHFAEFKTSTAGARQMNIAVGAQKVSNYDVLTAAGAEFKAAALTFTNVTVQSNGILKITLWKGTNNISGHVVLNGIEILNPNASVWMQLNCGGSAVPDTKWQSNVQEMQSDDFPFTRPGPIAADKRGNLWIVQEGAIFPTSANFNGKPGWAAIKCYNQKGIYLGQSITDVVNPTALGYDAAKDRLLVCENGPAQNVRIYTDLTTAPKCTSTLGVNGGVFAGPTPGLSYDPRAGGYARFFGPTGVGVDRSGNIYVANNCGGMSCDIRAFNPEGTLLWNSLGLDFTNCADFDPSQEASDLWTPNKHYAMDWSKHESGSEWSLKSYTWNPLKWGEQPNNFSSVYRRLGPRATPMLYTSGQGTVGPIYLYRFADEELVPAGKIWPNGHNIDVWVDANGDGIMQPGEVASIPSAGDLFESFDVDTAGNIYMAFGNRYPSAPYVAEFKYQGLNSHGGPIYSIAAGKVAFTPPPFPFNRVWDHCRLTHIASTDTMYLMGSTAANASDNIYGATITKVTHWSTAPTVAFTSVLPTPDSTPDFIYGHSPTPDGFLYMAMNVSNAMIFACENWGPVHVIDAGTGAPVAVLLPGPEVNGQDGWEDENMGIRAHYNAKDNEYDVVTENGGWGAKENLYRYSPFMGKDRDIGGPVKTGSILQNNGIFKLAINGSNAGKTSDRFNYCYRAADGDCSLVARVTSLSNTDGWATAGIMIRSNLTAGSAEAMMAASAKHGLTFQYRARNDRNSDAQDSISNTTPAIGKWIKITRSGNTITAYYHANGTADWTQLGRPVDIALETTAYIGLAVKSHASAVVTTGTFDNVLLTP